MWITVAVTDLRKRVRGYDVAGFKVKPEGVVEPIVQQDVPADVEAKFLAQEVVCFYWHSGQALLAWPVQAPNGQVVLAAVDVGHLRQAGWDLDEVGMARALPRVPGAGLDAAGGLDPRQAAVQAQQRAVLESRLRGKR